MSGGTCVHNPREQRSPTGVSPALPAPPRVLRLRCSLLTRWQVWCPARCAAQPLLDIGHQATQSTRFRLFPFRSPLLRESLVFSWREVLRCFRSPTGLPLGSSDHSDGVSPFGHQRITGCSAPPRRISAPYAVLLRPDRAWASPTCCLSLAPSALSLWRFLLLLPSSLGNVPQPNSPRREHWLDLGNHHPPFRRVAGLGGDEGIRTLDLLRAREALSQLSYIPTTTAPRR